MSHVATIWILQKINGDLTWSCFAGSKLLIVPLDLAKKLSFFPLELFIGQSNQKIFDKEWVPSHFLCFEVYVY